MTADHHLTVSERLAQATQDAAAKSGAAPAAAARVDDTLAGAINPQKLIDNFAEAWRISDADARQILEAHGFGGVLARLAAETAMTGLDEVTGPSLSPDGIYKLAGGAIQVRALGPGFNDPTRAPAPVLDAVKKSIAAFLPNASADPLGVLYRDRPAEYAKKWLATDAPRIDAYIRQHFGEAGPKYLVNSGIGANEQFNYFVSALANARPDRRTTWLLANSPKEISSLPVDATVDNTLFMEFSRSGITEETVKLHELTPRSAKRVVFANSGPLKALAERDGNLLLELPSEVSGRYGRNKTPILMAPMYVAGLDAAAYWSIIQTACDAMNLAEEAALPVVLAQYVRIQQLRRAVNHIYLGTNHDLLRASADEFCQFWNEGVNRDGNDITMSRYLGLPRDSHMNLEAILGTAEHKLAIFLLATRHGVAPASSEGVAPAAGSGVAPASSRCPANALSHPLLLQSADALQPEHAGLTAADVDLILALANVKRCSEKMPTILITVDSIDLTTSAWLGQLWADTTLVYSRLIGVDPGSNPEVKQVRTRAAQWLADRSAAQALID